MEMNCGDMLHVQASGIIKRLDGAGRLVLSADLRSRFHMQSGCLVEIFCTDAGLLIRPYDPYEMKK